jgi:hypothetical protein
MGVEQIEARRMSTHSSPSICFSSEISVHVFPVQRRSYAFAMVELIECVLYVTAFPIS